MLYRKLTYIFIYVTKQKHQDFNFVYNFNIQEQMIPQQQENQIHQKMYQMHRSIRNYQIEQYKQSIRRSINASNTVENMMNKIPYEKSEIIEWSQQMTELLPLLNSYQFSNESCLNIFKIVRNYPNVINLKLFVQMMNLMHENNIQYLLQDDIIGLLINLISFPVLQCKKQQDRIKQGYPTKSKQLQNVNFVQMEVVRNAFIILYKLNEKSQMARNYQILMHKTVMFCERTNKHFNNELKYEYLLLLRSSTTHTWKFHDQYKKIMKTIFSHFLNEKVEMCSFRTSQYLIIELQGLFNMIKMSRKWIRDYLDSHQNFQKIVEKSLQVYQIYLKNIKANYHQCQNYQIYINNIKISQDSPTKTQLSCNFQGNMMLTNKVLHELNMKTMHLIQQTTNNSFPWQQFFDKWIEILVIDFDSYGIDWFQKLTIVRQDIYYFISNIFCDENVGSHLIQALIFKYKIIQIFSRNVQHEYNPIIIHELMYAISSLLLNVLINEKFCIDKQMVQHVISESCLIEKICQKITQFTMSNQTKQLIIKSFIEYLSFEGEHNDKRIPYTPVFQKLEYYANSQHCSKDLVLLIDEMLKYCQH